MKGYIKSRSKTGKSHTIILDYGKDPASGKRKQSWITVKGSKEDAERRMADILLQIEAGTFIKPSKTTLADYLSSWLIDYVKPTLSPRGFERYESIARVHLVPSLGQIPLTQLKPEYLQSHYSDTIKNGLSPHSVRYHHVVLHKALQTALKLGLVNYNAADGVEVPGAGHTEIQIWNEDELNQFLEAAKDTPYYTLFYIALFTGMRRSELLALRWQDIDMVNGRISVNRCLHHLGNGEYIFTQPGQNKQYRSIDLPPSALMVLQSYRRAAEIVSGTFSSEVLGDNELVFNNLGKPLRPNTITRAWSILAVKAGVRPIKFNDARHTHAVLMLKQGINPRVVQERLGHSSLSVTLNTYSGITDGLQASAARQFDEVLQTNYVEGAAAELR
jgi:integrase